MAKDVLKEIKSLMRRMEDVPGGNTGFLNEVTCKWRDVIGEESFYDLLSGLKQGNMVTFGYISKANIEVPKGKRLNQATNRMNQFDDYETLGHNLGEEGKLVNVIKLSIYNMPWQTEEDISKKYSDWKTKRDELGSKYGVDFGAARFKTQNLNFNEKGGVSSYGGENQENMGHTYTNLNMNNIKPMSVEYFLIMDNGDLKPIDVKKLTLLPYKASSSAVDKLRAAGATEEDVEPLLNMKFTRFEHSHILFVSATPDSGIPTLLINNRLSSKIVGEGVNTQQIIQLAKDRYCRFTDKDVNFTED